MKRFFAILLAAVIILTLAACGSTGKDPAATTGSTTGAAGGQDSSKTPDMKSTYVSPERIKISYLIQEHGSTPFNKDWVLWKNITEATNIEFDFMPAAGEAFIQKLRMLFATNDLPDLINFNLATANEFGVTGQLVKLNEHLDKMPNFVKILDAEKSARDTLTAGDGNMYFAPVVGLPKYTKIWLYRADIFEKHGLKPPANTDELYEVLKQLKQLYPNSTPLISRNIMNSAIGNWFTDLTYQWETGQMMYYNNKAGKWQFGPIEDNFKAMLQYLNKLLSEKLLDPEWSTLATKQWEDKMYADDQAFVTYDFIYRIETMLPAATAKNPNWKLKALPPIIQEGLGEGKYPIRSQIVQSDGMMVSSDSKYVNELMKFFDFLYSDEGSLLANFGKVGDTAVKNADGSYNWTGNIKTPMNPSGTDEYNTKFGFLTLGSYLLANPNTNEILYLSNKDVRDAFDEFDRNNYPAPLQPVLKFTEEERKQLADLESAIWDYSLAEQVKFVQNGGFDRWDAYVGKIKEMNVDKLVELYNTMQARQK